MSNKDPRGVTRGKCSKCDCTQYEYDESTGKASCTYCECPAPAHDNMDKTLPPVGSGDSTFLFAFTPRKGGGMTAEVSKISARVDPPVIIVPHESDMPSTSQVLVLKPQENLLTDILNNADKEINSDEIPMPNALPDYVNTALAKRHLEAKHRSAICRAVVSKLIDENKSTNNHLLKAAKKIRNKYSPMKRATDPGGKALYKKLVRTRDRQRNGPNSKSAEPSNNLAPLSANEAREAMIQDWASGKRSVTIMAPYLESTRTLRNKEANKTKSLNLLVDYPALTIPQLLLKEFAEMDDIQVTVTVMRENWLEKLPCFRRYFSEQEIFRIDDNFSSEQQTVMVLENLHRMPLWLKKSKTRRGQQAGTGTAALESRAIRVLEVFPENTPIAEARPDAKDPLRLSAIGNAMGSANFFAISDAEPIFNTEDPIDALLLLLATYWVFHLNFGVENKLPILFLAACVLGTVKVKNYVAKNDKFLDLCRDHFGMEV